VVPIIEYRKYRIIREGFTFSRVRDDRIYRTGDIIELTDEEFRGMPQGAVKIVDDVKPIPQPKPLIERVKDIAPTVVRKAEKENEKQTEIDRVMSLKGKAIIDYAKSHNIKFGRGCYSVKKRKQKLIDWAEAQ